LTKAHVLHGKTNEFLMANIFGCMISILVIAKRGERSQVKKEFMTKFSGRMAAVGKLVFRLNKAVGEEITSNLFAEVFPPSIDFDPTTMERGQKSQLLDGYFAHALWDSSDMSRYPGRETCGTGRRF